MFPQLEGVQHSKYLPAHTMLAEPRDLEGEKKLWKK